MILRILTPLLVLCMALFAAETKSPDTGVQSYEKLLAQLKKEPGHSDEKSLQEALLYKLINLSRIKAPAPIPVKTPKTEEAYRKLAADYGEWLLQKSKTEEDLQSLQDKLEGVNDQMGQSRMDDNTTRLTLKLEEAFFSKGIDLSRQKEAHLKEAIDAAPSAFIRALGHVRFDENRTVSNLRQIEKEIRGVDRHIQKLEVEKERLNLLGRTDAARRVELQIAKLKDRKTQLLNRKLLELFVRFSEALQRKEVNRAFAVQKEMTKIVKRSYPPQIQETMGRLFRIMENATLGRAATLKGATMAELRGTMELFWQEANAPLFHINKTPISAFKLFSALLIFILGFIIGQFYKSGVKRLTEHSESITPSTQTLLANLGYYTIVVIAFFITLKVLGINLTSIALVAGALSVGIGFGLQNIVSNFVSGLILMFERSIKIGDYVEFDDHLRGHVSDIRMRSTTITTNDNIDVIVPNQDLIQNRVVNWTMNDRLRRFRIPFGVAYGTDADKVEQVILEAVRTSGFTDIYESGRRRTRVIMTGMGDSSVNFDLFVWVQGREILYPKRTESRFLKLIYKTLNIHGIEIPFPQRDIHIRSVDAQLPLRIEKPPSDSAPTDQTDTSSSR